MEARKEPNSSNTSYLPSNNDLHHHYHHLMNNNGGNNLIGNNHNNNHATNIGVAKLGLNANTKTVTSSTTGTSISTSLTALIPPLVTAHVPQSSSTLVPASLTPAQQHTSNTSLSSRQLPFPYNMNNYHSGGY